MKLLMVITDGFEELEAVGTLAILRRANLDVTLAVIDNTKATGRYNLLLKGDTNLADIDDLNIYDMLIIPGGPEYIKEERDERFLMMVKDFARCDKYIAAICAGPTILGHLGLLKGKNYTCFTSMNEDFGGTYIDRYVVRDGKIITGRSCAASIDFALEIVDTLLGKKALNKLKDEIYYDEVK